MEVESLSWVGFYWFVQKQNRAWSHFVLLVPAPPSNMKVTRSNTILLSSSPEPSWSPLMLKMIGLSGDFTETFGLVSFSRSSVKDWKGRKLCPEPRLSSAVCFTVWINLHFCGFLLVWRQNGFKELKTGLMQLRTWRMRRRVSVWRNQKFPSQVGSSARSQSEETVGCVS